jgi:hypothetical protein
MVLTRTAEPLMMLMMNLCCTHVPCCDLWFCITGTLFTYDIASGPGFHFWKSNTLSQDRSLFPGCKRKCCYSYRHVPVSISGTYFRSSELKGMSVVVPATMSTNNTRNHELPPFTLTKWEVPCRYPSCFLLGEGISIETQAIMWVACS